MRDIEEVPVDEHGTPTPLKADDPPAPEAIDEGLPAYDPDFVDDVEESKS